MFIFNVFFCLICLDLEKLVFIFLIKKLKRLNYMEKMVFIFKKKRLKKVKLYSLYKLS